MTSLTVIDVSERRPDTTTLLPLHLYDIIIVSFSGGKDSACLVLDLIDRGVPKEKIQLWHQCVDGRPRHLGGEDDQDQLKMDWPVTEAYCQAFAKALDLRIFWQWKQGGFHREMNRENSLTAPVSFVRQDGSIGTAGGVRGKYSTRKKFPQVSADLSVRWCSAYLKIDVSAMAINNDPILKNKKILFLTGERRQESTARSKYAEKEEHRCNNNRRRVDQWRSVIDWDENRIWDTIRRHRIVAHPAYFIGFGRVSCASCIFGLPDQWATLRKIAPNLVEQIARFEYNNACTIKKGQTVIDQANRGIPYKESDDCELVSLALGHAYPDNGIVVSDGQEWKLPGGAFKRCGGPT